LHDLLGIGDPPALSRHPKCGASWERFALDQVLCIALDDLALDALYVVFTGDRRYGLASRTARSDAMKLPAASKRKWP
jgi:hypothetical protein